ncbi:MAG: Ig-like domain-containing protein [Lachnospiraceae bacterium]|nr:Ig-like domain-containing protein [Lachnospiraceae bacterium]
MIKKRFRNLAVVVVSMAVIGTNLGFSDYIEIIEDNHKQPPIIEGIEECDEDCSCPICEDVGNIEGIEDDFEWEDTDSSDYEEDSDSQDEGCDCDNCEEEWEEDSNAQGDGCGCENCQEMCGDSCDCESEEESEESESEPALSKEKLSIKAGNNKKIKVLGEYDEVQWESSDKSVATVNQNGKITGIKSGEVTITAYVTCYMYEMDAEDTDEYDSVEEEYNEITDDLYDWGMSDETWDGEEELIPVTYELECEITVKGGTISHKQAKLKVGKSKKIRVKGAKGKVKWTSSNNAVCTVKNGTIKAKRAGKTIITAKVAGAKFKCKVTVKKK